MCIRDRRWWAHDKVHYYFIFFKTTKKWRPITLLNVSYKIASGFIANRIKRVLPNNIYSDQAGFINGRCISENTRLLYDIIHYTEKRNIPELLLLIDFEKAFVSVSWSFIKKKLSFFRFGSDIKKVDWNILQKYQILFCCQQTSLHLVPNRKGL